MWLSKPTSPVGFTGAKTGVVTTGGAVISVRTDMERRAPELAVPYGMAVCMPQGEQVIMLPESGVCLGAVNRAGGLLPGEVRLFSAGGAEIRLCADGSVVINGQVFPKAKNLKGEVPDGN